MKLLYSFTKEKYPRLSFISLPYGLKKIKIKVDSGIVTIANIGNIGSTNINLLTDLQFPIIDGKSPNTFKILYWSDNTKEIQIFIEEIGGVPDPNYFDDTPTIMPEIIQDETTEQEEEQDAI